MSAALRSMIMLAGLLAAGWANITRTEVPPQPHRIDPRLLKLRHFFTGLHAPAYSLSEQFLEASDQNGLDWRLLPSVSVLESGGGKQYTNNNILGWDSCRQGFPSVRAGIQHVARRLAHSPLYKDKSLDGILTTYNPDPGYPHRVKSLMTRLGSGPASRSTSP